MRRRRRPSRLDWRLLLVVWGMGLVTLMVVWSLLISPEQTMAWMVDLLERLVRVRCQ